MLIPLKWKTLLDVGKLLYRECGQGRYRWMAALIHDVFRNHKHRLDIGRILQEAKR
ncbi:MAG: hypothetical protein QGH58_01290 [Arenicellales bacterium]|nr:hypothetical protein [Arenicellales bacterium]MDP6552239.1 hypothetical protein [Arenicellales bacterium]MDP6790520.1 hypothetical protein [Arenicellales bacterium]